MSKKMVLGIIFMGAFGGIGLAVTVELLISGLTGSHYYHGSQSFMEQFDSETTPLIIQRSLYALYGVLTLVSFSVLRDMKWTPLAKLSIHGIIVAITGSVIGGVLGWWPQLSWAIGFIAIVLSLYTTAWIGYLVVTNYRIAKLNRQFRLRLGLPQAQLFFEPNQPILTPKDFTAELLAFKEREHPDLFIISESMEPLVEFGGQRYRAMLEQPRTVSTSSALISVLTMVGAYNFGFKFVYFYPVDGNDVIQ
ncbi:DUF3021 family protein [Arcanobacterium phocisimile]|uniref:DUF3021 family protein n=1 Tax=Arcanobacterium phocisimile TaxID=1302235 RepID=A0ABX7IEG7_9ACTO|nr:DUF3021 family protein [Arcanobacterium phocisimile]QRV01533.1 DUF3021 family protein [Arcanobacterium phocisimile]